MAIYWNENHDEKKKKHLKWVNKDKAFDFIYVRSEMSYQHPNRHVRQRVGYIRPELRVDIICGIVNI